MQTRSQPILHSTTMPTQTLLIVDDTPENLKVLGEFLKPIYQIRATNSGTRALQAVNQQPRPDLILLDVMMPEMDGYEVLRRIHRHNYLMFALLFLLFLIFWMEAAHADPSLRLSGFGTLGYQADNNTRIAQNRDISQYSQYATGPSWKLDSRIGAQIELRLDPTTDLVAQFIARDHFKSSLDSSMELAYLALRPNTKLNIRLGRVGYDAFLMSDYRNVGYAYTWVRPPLEFYGWIPIFYVDGMDAVYTMLGNNEIWRVKAQAGSNQYWIPIAGGVGGGYQFKTDNLATISVSRQASYWRVKAAHSRFTVKTEVPVFLPLLTGLDQVTAAGIPTMSAEAADLREQISFQGAQIRYTTLGAVYDDNTWLIQAELGHSTSARVVPTGQMAYASVAHRFGDWMPFVMFGTYHPGPFMRGADYDLGTTLNTSLRDPALSIGNNIRIHNNTVSLGIRWDFAPHASFKLQFDSTRNHPPGYGIWNIAREISEQSNRLNQLTATVDFVF